MRKARASCIDIHFSSSIGDSMRRLFLLFTLLAVAIVGLLTTQKAAAAQDGTLTLTLNQPSAVADYYVDGQLVASQTATVQISVAPSKWHKVEAKNITDSTANGVYRWRDAVKWVYTSAGSTKTVKLTLYKQYLQGFYQLTCKIKNAPLDAYCDTTIDGVTAASIPQNGLVTYALAPGSHTVNVRVAPNGTLITVQPSNFRPTIYAGGTQKQTATLTAYVCQYTWTLYLDPYKCATGPATTEHKVSEIFENGIMLWTESSGVYDVLTYEKSGFSYTRYGFNDPLNIQADSSGAVGTPPPGLYAPVNGFGSIWRGDVAFNKNLRQLMGWALTPEAGYEATMQCGVSTINPLTICYITLPDGRLIYIANRSGTPWWGFVN
jgi:hypothetical protein